MDSCIDYDYYDDMIQISVWETHYTAVMILEIKSHPDLNIANDFNTFYNWFIVAYPEYKNDYWFNRVGEQAFKQIPKCK